MCDVCVVGLFDCIFDGLTVCVSGCVVVVGMWLWFVVCCVCSCVCVCVCGDYVSGCMFVWLVVCVSV